MDMYLENSSTTDEMMQLYTNIAGTYGNKAINVERNMRSAINTALNNRSSFAHSMLSSMGVGECHDLTVQQFILYTGSYLLYFQPIVDGPAFQSLQEQERALAARQDTLAALLKTE